MHKTEHKKAPRCDGWKSDPFKILEKVKFVAYALQPATVVVDAEEVCDDWANTNTILIQEKPKPTEADLRPIALADNSY